MDATIGEKTSEWLSVSELVGKYILGRYTNVLRALEQYADQMPDAIQRKRNAAKITFYLNINAIDDFCKLSGFVRKSDGFKSGEKNVDVLNSVQKTKRKTKPNKNQNEK